MMRAFLFLLSAACLIAQEGTPPPELGAIEGIVLEADTQEGVARVRLVLNSVGGTAEPRGAITGEDGRFAFSGVKPGRYTLAADRSGFILPKGSLSTELTLEPGARLNGVVVELVRSAVVAGRVTDESGRPLAKFSVRAMEYRTTGGQRRLTPVDTATTDDRGEYRLYGIAPGAYYFLATSRDPVFALGGGTPQQYYPGVEQEDQAATLTLAAGDERQGLDFRLPLGVSPGVTIKGRFFVPEGTEAPVVIVELLGRDLSSGRRSMTTAGPSGEFEIAGVQPGSYSLIAGTVVNSGLVAVRELEVGVADIEGIDLIPLPAIQFKVESRVEPPDAEVTLSRGRIILRGALPYASTSATLDENGSGTALVLLPDTYNITVTLQDRDSYLKSAMQGDRNALREGVVITTDPAPLDLVIGAPGLHLGGAITDPDGNPSPGAVVVLLPDEERAPQIHLYKRTIADQSGSYQLQGIAPGAYRALALPRLDGGEEQSPEFADQFAERFTTVELGTQDQTSLDLTVVRLTP